jgi:succinate dehydrogenase/fumarate reductase flavoprotein subunit
MEADIVVVGGGTTGPLAAIRRRAPRQKRRDGRP